MYEYFALARKFFKVKANGTSQYSCWRQFDRPLPVPPFCLPLAPHAFFLPPPPPPTLSDTHAHAHTSAHAHTKQNFRTHARTRVQTLAYRPVQAPGLEDKDGGGDSRGSHTDWCEAKVRAEHPGQGFKSQSICSKRRQSSQGQLKRIILHRTAPCSKSLPPPGVPC